ncbi:MAG TPA: flagellar basal-body rod protein FlgF [Thiotrichales bacterium]|nr:flagellar basal-body rod protein FlgF [Thiotrichales bacterium]
MDRMIFVSMSGAKEMMKAQAVNTNNLANVGTIGFKADLEASNSKPVYGPGFADRVYATTEGGAAGNAGVDFSQGSIISTGRELDFAINGKGWFAVQAADGGEAYTRAGNLHLDEVGRLTTATGNAVLGDGGPITIPNNAKLEIAADGTISIQPLGQPVNTLAIIDRIKLVNPPQQQLQKGVDGLMHLPPGQTAEADASVTTVAGALESSNVNAVSSMVRMIELARAYESHIKLISAAEKNDEASAQMLRMS